LVPSEEPFLDNRSIAPRRKKVDHLSILHTSRSPFFRFFFATFSILRQVLLREMRVGLIMGTVCGLTIGVVAFFWHNNIYLGLVVGLAMVTAMTVAATMGVLAPSFFKKIGIDPAIASSPFVQTANDIIGILIYFGTATLFINHLR
jgi:magnesium transporter